MAVSPSTEYTQAPDGVRLAFQVAGDGPRDVVVVSGSAYPIDLLWESPDFVHFAGRLARFSRTIWPDRRGVGASGGDFRDHFNDETGMADLTAVLNAVGCGRVTVLGTGMRGSLAIAYAAAHPERVESLVLFDTFAHFVQDQGDPWGAPLDDVNRTAENYPNVWGTLGMIDVVAPSRAGDESFRDWLARCQRLGLSPDESANGYRMSAEADVRSLLPRVAVPTLILHRSEDRYVPVEAGRYLAEHIAGARYIELAGADHYVFIGDSDRVVDEIEEFLTGTHQGPEGDVITSTILFTDIVASTQQESRLGHREWAKRARAHDVMVRDQLQRHRGHEVKTLGDGFLATFDTTSRAIRAARDIVSSASDLGLEVRAGVHTGEVEVGPDDVSGLTVNVAKRICDLAEPGEVLVSRTVTDLVLGSGFTFTERGPYQLKGVPGEWALFAVAP